MYGTHKLVRYWNQNPVATFNRRSEGRVLVGSVRGPRESHAGRIEVLVKPVALRRGGLGRLTIQVTVTVTRTY